METWVYINKTFSGFGIFHQQYPSILTWCSLQKNILMKNHPKDLLIQKFRFPCKDKNSAVQQIVQIYQRQSHQKCPWVFKIYTIYTWFVSSKHSHYLMVVCTILHWQITECSMVSRWSFQLWLGNCSTWLTCGSHNSYWSAISSG